jgi:hypothetical protein
MELSEIERIHETTDHKEANEFLDAGWVLLAAVHGTSSAGDGERPFILYSLGRPGSQ